MKAKQRTKGEIARLGAIFAEIGSDLTPAANLQDALLVARPEEGLTRYEKSETCGKTMYPTESEARGAAKARKRKGGGFLRVYFCRDCHSYHLTSTPNSAR